MKSRFSSGMAFVVVLVAVCGIAFSFGGCGKTATTPETPVEPSLPPNPAGMLLDGAVDDLALSALADLLPSPAPSSDIATDGFMMTRLEGLLNPEASVGEVNTALESNSVRIVSMTPASPMVCLVVPELASMAEAESLGAALEESGAFLRVFSAWVSRPDPVISDQPPPHPTNPNSRDDLGIEFIPDHLRAIRMTSAWNAARQALDSGHRVPVLIPDAYYQRHSPDGLSALQILPGAGSITTSTDAANTFLIGNHGFSVAGLLGGNTPQTAYHPPGTSPSPSNLLDMQGITVDGLTEMEVLTHTVRRFPAAGNFVLNYCLGWHEDFQVTTRVRRALDTMIWRILVAGHRHRFFFATAAGNSGDVAGDLGSARYDGPLAASRLWADPRGMVEGHPVSPADQLALDTAWTMLLAVDPLGALPLDNGLVVGASDLEGDPTSFSSLHWDLLAPGVSAQAVCAVIDPGFGQDAGLCDGSHSSYSGTSFAAPQVAGLAAYLWSLDPSLSPSAIRTLIYRSALHSNDPGQIDAYLATQFVDNSIGSAPVRSSILDVAGSSPFDSTGNRVFDEQDLMAFMQTFGHYEGLRDLEGGEPSKDNSRHDLNGDGYTGGDFRYRFDLSVDPIPTFTQVTQTIEDSTITFDEMHVNDMDCLCYYAYSDLYQGDVDARREMLADSCGVSNPSGWDGLWLWDAQWSTWEINNSWPAGQCSLATEVVTIPGFDGQVVPICRSNERKPPWCPNAEFWCYNASDFDYLPDWATIVTECSLPLWTDQTISASRRVEYVYYNDGGWMATSVRDWSYHGALNGDVITLEMTHYSYHYDDTGPWASSQELCSSRIATGTRVGSASEACELARAEEGEPSWPSAAINAAIVNPFDSLSLAPQLPVHREDDSNPEHKVWHTWKPRVR